ncbi:LADA_0C04962g1_1 [Lachancea dasiensis]|uniref:LADA_0C04962g1_1 n=1 Tax=Lachancea dasiensis TaxID=1072105 RepID=A0A1G4IYU6_9SACH|nr:LADA_0C04962g1_1 [Lachancea dasiensis]
MTILTPDELIEKLCEEIAYSGGRILLTKFWDLVSEEVDNLDNRLKIFILRCFHVHRDTSLTRAGKLLEATNYDELTEGCEDVYCSITEDMLYTFLTGYCKRECSIGGLAFELLIEIAKSKQAGINTMDLARKTSQDPRSITGRIKKLGNLVVGVQTIYKGHVVKHLRLSKFGVQIASDSNYSSMKDNLKSIVEVVKSSKNGVRQLIDLKRELKFDKDKRLSKSFIAAISSLVTGGYLKKVLVVSPSSPSMKIRCVKYLKDYQPELKQGNDFEEETDLEEGHEGGENNDAEEAEGGEELELLGNDNATQLLQGKNLVIEDETNFDRKLFLLNRFHPLQNQTYALVDKRGIEGLSSMQAVSILTGNDYKRSFTKCSEYYIDTIGKENKSDREFGLVKVYDFEGKRKFHRLFTKRHFNTLVSGENMREETDFPLIKVQKNTLRVLSDKAYSPLSNTLRFIENDHGGLFFWNGELKAPANENAVPRGRKRKGQAELIGRGAQEDSKKMKPSHTESILTLITDEQKKLKDETTENIEVSVSDAGQDDKANIAISIDGLSANSLKSLQRQRAILEVLTKSGGVSLFRDQFFEDVKKLMGSKTTLDKKTIKGDLNLLRASNKIGFQIDRLRSRKVLFLPHIPQETISKFLLNEKESKKSYFKDVIHNADIYFFDESQRERFLRGGGSAERIKNFEKKTSNGRRGPALRKAPKGPDKDNAEETITLTDSAAERQSLIDNTMAQYSKEDSSGYRRYNVGTKVGVRVLVMAVIITEIVNGEVVWDLITKLFPSNSLSNLEKQWTTRRIKMGHGGWKALKMKWRKILVEAMKEEQLTMRDVETLDLPKLIRIWESADQKPPETEFKLLRNHEDNVKKFTLIREPRNVPHPATVETASMVQRESNLLRKCYMYRAGQECLSVKKEDQIRTAVRSALLERGTGGFNDISALQAFEKGDIEKTVLDMAKEKQISFLNPSKLQLTDGLHEMLVKKGDFESMEKAAEYHAQLSNIFEGRRGLVIKEELTNQAALVIIELLHSASIAMAGVPILSEEHPMHYTTRRYGFGALIPPLIVFQDKSSNKRLTQSIPIPMGRPYSRLWINSGGKVRPQVWKQVVALILLEICFNPGISAGRLSLHCAQLLAPAEVEEIVIWCTNSRYVSKLEFGGLLVNSTWFLAL